MKGNKKVRIVKGDAVLTATPNTEKEEPTYQTDIQKCLTCKKPANKCKGDCK